MTAALEASKVDLRRGPRQVLTDVSVQVEPGDIVALVGPNGAGKSSLLSVLCGDLLPDRGSVHLMGEPLASWSTREQSRRRSVLPQRVTVSFPFSVSEIVMMGRAPWAGTPESDHDDAEVAAALGKADVTALAERAFSTLSGGEASRASLARVLAQAAPVILLDEPTASLDIRHQEGVLTTARDLAREGAAVVVVLHDLNLAGAYADQIIVLNDGRVARAGTPVEVLDATLLSEVYGCELEVITHPSQGRPLVLPKR